MVLGWLFGENNRQPLDNLHYVRDAPDTFWNKGIKTSNEMEGRPRKFLLTLAMCRAKRGPQ